MLCLWHGRLCGARSVAVAGRKTAGCFLSALRCLCGVLYTAVEGEQHEAVVQRGAETKREGED